MKKIIAALLIIILLPTAVLGKGTLARPSRVSGSIQENGYYISFTNVQKGTQQGKFFGEIDIKGKGNWSSQNGILLKKEIQSGQGTFNIVLSDEEVKKIAGDSDTYSFRVRILSGKEKSDFSAAITLGYKNIFSNYSAWAKKDLIKAQEYRFISATMKDNMKGNITREELAEAVVKVYEKLYHKTSHGNKNHFSDTKNPYVNMAYDLGLMKGMGNNKFNPQSGVTRQEYAVVLNKLKTLEQKAEIKIKDQQSISKYALSDVEKALSNQLLHLDKKGNFYPKKVMSREEVLSSLVRNI